MGISKSELFTADYNKVAAIAKALAHPARVAIIEYLLQHETCICNDLVGALPLSQPTISQHLKELKQAGLIKRKINGDKTGYCIEEQTWEEARTIMLNIFIPRIGKRYGNQDNNRNK